MKKHFLLFAGFLALAFTAPMVHAQFILIQDIKLYDSPDEYIGKYWPANTPANDARNMDTDARMAPENTSDPQMRLFEGCDLKLRITIRDWISESIPDDKAVYIKFQCTDINGDILQGATTIPDSVAIPKGKTYFEIPYKINHMPDAENGRFIKIDGYITSPDIIPYSLNVSENFNNANIFNRFTYNLEYSPRTTLHKGYIRLNIQGASPQIVCSFDGGLNWVKPQDEFTDSYIDKALKAGVIYIKEPGSCLLETIPFGKVPGGIDNPDPENPILRPVTIPNIANAITNYEPGTHFIYSTSDFVFTIRPTGTNAGLVPLVRTNRTSIPDSEGVKIEDNGDGSYTVTIILIQQDITLSIDFATANEAIDSGNKVWANNDRLYIQASANTIANIYQATGALAKSMVVSAGETASISLPAGFYIVKLDNDKTYKVTLR